MAVAALFSLATVSANAANYSFTILDGLNGGNTSAYSINDSGQIVGFSQTAGINGATLWNNGVGTDISPQGSSFSIAISINDFGQIVGSSQTAGSSGRPTIWNNGVATDISTEGDVSSINNSGQIVGSSLSAEGYSSATLWNNGVTTLLTNPQDIFYSNAASINNLGQIVGVSVTGDFDSRALLWDNGVVTDLNSFLSASDVSAGWVLSSATDINDNGWIIGNATNTVSNVQRGFLLQSISPVPEADTSAMLLTGLGVIGFMARRRKNTQA